MIHDWQPDGEWFRCANDGCTARSKSGTSRGVCQPRSAPKPPASEADRAARRAEREARRAALAKDWGRCQHKGAQLEQDGEPWVIRCGCPNTDQMPVHACAVHGACIRFADNPSMLPAGVHACWHCPDFAERAEDPAAA